MTNQKLKIRRYIQKCPKQKFLQLRYADLAEIVGSTVGVAYYSLIYIVLAGPVQIAHRATL